MWGCVARVWSCGAGLCAWAAVVCVARGRVRGARCRRVVVRGRSCVGGRANGAPVCAWRAVVIVGGLSDGRSCAWPAVTCGRALVCLLVRFGMRLCAVRVAAHW